MKLTIFGLTDTGRSRSRNEDALVVVDPAGILHHQFSSELQLTVKDSGVLLMVADGMGGAAAGEVASRIAVTSVPASMYTQLGAASHESPDRTADALEAATAMANAQINEYSVRIPNHTGMGTTATIAALAGRVLVVSQIGDSRAYLLRAGRAKQLTRDQSLMQRLVDAGELTQEEADKSERRNIILQALGPEAEIVTDLSRCEVQDGDLILLCTDGLTGQVTEADIVRLAADATGVRELAVSLVQLANDRGGPDNITVVLARIADEPLSPGRSPGHTVASTDTLSRALVYSVLVATLLGLIVILARR